MTLTSIKPRESIKDVASTTYTYDHAGMRVQKSSASSTTVYPSRLYEVTGTSTKKHIYAGDTLVATVESDTPAPKIYHVHSNHLGSTQATTDFNGHIHQVLDYHPFGGIRVEQQLSHHNQTNRYTGHDYDSETDLSYMGARYYDGQSGRFTAQDPVSLALGDWKTVQDKTDGKLGFYLSNPQAQNSYSYAANNPIKYIDKNGEFFWFPAIVVGAIVADQLMSAKVLTDDANMSVRTQNSSLPELVAQEYGAPTQIVGAMALGADAYGTFRGRPQSIQDVVSSAKHVFTNRYGTTQRVKGGGFDATKNDFYSIDGITNVKVRNKGNLLTGEVDGNKVTARSYSKEGRPTLQINHKSGEKTEIRYNKGDKDYD